MHCMFDHQPDRQMCQLQVSIMSAIRHPNVVLFMGVCLDPPCMVTEVSPPFAALLLAPGSCYFAVL